jgi:hypothetical protein
MEEKPIDKVRKHANAAHVMFAPITLRIWIKVNDSHDAACEKLASLQSLSRGEENAEHAKTWLGDMLTFVRRPDYVGLTFLVTEDDLKRPLGEMLEEIEQTLADLGLPGCDGWDLNP